MFRYAVPFWPLQGARSDETQICGSLKWGFFFVAFLCQTRKGRNVEKLYLEWELAAAANPGIRRHCPNCGKTVLFKDSLQKRRNANGKNIYEFAIYKCPSGHTWNRKTASYQPRFYVENPSGDETPQLGEGPNQTLRIAQCLAEGLAEIEISFKTVQGSWRLDKLLALHIADWSRSQIEAHIREGRIRLDRRIVKSKTLVRAGQTVQINLTDLPDPAAGWY